MLSENFLRHFLTRQFLEASRMLTEKRPYIVLRTTRSVTVWRGVCMPVDGPYKGGCFSFRIKFPPQYPQEKPRVIFDDESFIWSPFISDTGQLHVDHVLSHLSITDNAPYWICHFLTFVFGSMKAVQTAVTDFPCDRYREPNEQAFADVLSDPSAFRSHASRCAQACATAFSERLRSGHGLLEDSITSSPSPAGRPVVLEISDSFDVAAAFHAVLSQHQVNRATNERSFPQFLESVLAQLDQEAHPVTARK